MVVYTREAMKLLKSSWFRYEPTRLDDGRKGNRLFASQYVVTDLIRLKDYIRIWGASDHITCRESVRRDLVDYVKTRTGFGRNIPGVLMVSFYLKTTAGAVNQVMRGGNLEGPDDRPIICGHVVGVDLAAHCFFDSNSGFYTMAGATPLEHAEDAEKFIEDNYTNEGLTRESNDRGVFLLDKVG